MGQITAEVIADSISPDAIRLSTLQVTYPRFIHSEFMTHRVFERNSASSRAIPVAKQIVALRMDPAMPVELAYNQPGMQAGERCTAEDEKEARRLIATGLQYMTYIVEKLAELGPPHPETGKPLGIHKQWANRYLEPWMWHTVVVTATEWDNFFEQRVSHLAQPEIRVLAEQMQKALSNSTPRELGYGDWHTPYIREDEEHWRKKIRCSVSAARCARLSYLTQKGIRDQSEDEKMFRRLMNPGDGPPHWSPLGHVATPAKKDEEVLGPLVGFHQLRHWGIDNVLG